MLVPSRCGKGLALLSPLRCSGSWLLYMERALCCAVPALGCSTKARHKKLRRLFVPSLSERLRQPGAWRAHSPRGQRTFCPPSHQPQSPPRWSGSTLDLLRPFVLGTAGNVFRRLIFSLSFADPQFQLITQKSSLRLSSGHSGPVLTLSNAARSSPFRPHLLVADAGVWGTFLLGVAFRHVICGFYLLFPSQSGCPPRFKNFPQTRQCKTPFRGWMSVLSSFVSLFIFYVLSYLLSK